MSDYLTLEIQRSLYQYYLLDDSDSELLMLHTLMKEPGHYRGAIFGKEYVNRSREESAERWRKSWLGPNPIYGALNFRRSFRMRRALFERIRADIELHDARFPHETFFRHCPDATGRPAIDINLKMASALHQLAYNVPSYGLLSYALDVGASSSDAFLENFCTAVVWLYTEQTLGEAEEDTISRILEKNVMRGLPGLYLSIDTSGAEVRQLSTAKTRMVRNTPSSCKRRLIMRATSVISSSALQVSVPIIPY